MDEAAERLENSILFDCYGALLSSRQRDYYDLYFNEDLSLSEIADLRGISRQGAWDTIRHACEKLKEIEEKTGLVARITELENQLAELRGK